MHVFKVCVQTYKPWVGVKQCWHPLPLPSVTLSGEVRVTLLAKGLLTELPKEGEKQRTDHRMFRKIRIEILAELLLIAVGRGFFTSPWMPFPWSTKLLLWISMSSACLPCLGGGESVCLFFFLISFFKCNSLRQKTANYPHLPQLCVVLPHCKMAEQKA